MKRINENEIVLTNQELEYIRDFIRSTLECDWDDHTSRFYGCKETHEEGLRRMDPVFYDMAEQMGII